MKLKSIEIEGFRTFKKKVKFDLTRFNSDSFIYVTGKNEIEVKLGANDIGKSSLFEALIWCLYGITSTKLKAGNVANWDVGKCKVIIELEKEGLFCRIERTWNPNTLTVYTDDLDRGKEKTQEELEQIIGMDYYSFLYSVFISQFTAKFFDLDSTDKLKIFSDILKFDEWIDRSELSKIKAHEIKRDIIEKDMALSSITGQITSLKEINYNIQIDEWDIENEELIKAIKNKLNTYDNKVLELEKEKKEFIEGIFLIKEDLKSVKDNCSKADNSLIDFRNRLAEQREKLVEHTVLIKQKEESIKRLKRNKGECPHCLQVVGEKHKNIILKQLKSEIDDIFLVVESKNKKIEKSIKELEKYSKEVRQLNDELHEINSELIKEVSDLSNIKDDMDHVKCDIIDDGDSLEKEEKKTNPYKKLELEKENKLKVLKNKKEMIVGDMKKLQEKHLLCSYWIKGFKDIRLMVLSEALDEFEMHINNNLEKLGLNDWEVCLDIERETKDGKSIKKGFEVFINSPYNKKQVPFKAWGGGVSQRLRIAGTMGLIDLIRNRTSVDWDIEIWDEPLQHLGIEGISAVVQTLSERAKDNNKKVFLIEHRDLSSEGLFSDTLTIIKDKDGSYIEKV